jgi:hypothetical protein
MKNNGEYYLGGYYLLKLRAPTFGAYINNFIYTCSSCINDNLIEGWTNYKPEVLEELKTKYCITDIESMQKWIFENFNINHAWLNVFPSAELALEFKNKFFSHLSDIVLLSINFDSIETNEILNEFNPKETRIEMRMREILKNNIQEKREESFIGFDLIGIEDVGQFHTFHCHNIGNELESKFDLKLNQYGLFENSKNLTSVAEGLSSQVIRCEPVPWFVAKVKMVQ